MTHARHATIAAAALMAAALPALAPAQPAQQAAPAAQAAPAYTKVGFVDTIRVMREAKEPQRLQKALEAEYEKREKEIAAGAPRDAERRRSALAEDMNLRREEANKQIADKANAAIKRIAERENFDAVFIEAAYASTRIDLTDKVIKALDAER
jgi:outer membrane protein